MFYMRKVLPNNEVKIQHLPTGEADNYEHAVNILLNCSKAKGGKDACFGCENFVQCLNNFDTRVVNRR